MNNEMLSEKELNALDAKEVRISDKRLHEKGVVYLGQTCADGITKRRGR